MWLMMTRNLRSGCTVDKSNITPCPCCKQPRPYPTEPGEWKYRTFGGWYHVTIKYDSEGLTMTHEGETEPAWWVENAEWKQIKI